jgi:uroporphyrinogen-III synthase
MNDDVTILSTRKLPETLKQALNGNAIELIDYDFIGINFLINKVVEDKLLNAEEHIVFTSGNAVEGTVKNLQQTEDAFTGKKFFCIEGNTADMVTKLNAGPIVAMGKSSQNLVENIKVIAPQKLTFISGTNRLSTIPDGLHEAGIRFDEIAVYDTVKTGRKIEQAYDGILFFSPSGVESFFDSNELPPSVICFCIGDTTAAELRKRADNVVVTGSRPSVEAVVMEAIDYYKARK